MMGERLRQQAIAAQTVARIQDFLPQHDALGRRRFLRRRFLWLHRSRRGLCFRRVVPGFLLLAKKAAEESKPVHRLLRRNSMSIPLPG
jgi:hypothetical protein